MSDILVDTIDGFAYKYGISEVFISLVILPYFSNIAVQGRLHYIFLFNDLEIGVFCLTFYWHRLLHQFHVEYMFFIVSAVIFAYRNEMDLCIGITVGSAVQIALFVLPGSVLIGWAMDHSMSLFFRYVCDY